MSRRPSRFTEADLNRAAKVAKKHGMAVEVTTDGTIRLSTDVKESPPPVKRVPVL
jgi:hypothetical protein